MQAHDLGPWHYGKRSKDQGKHADLSCIHRFLTRKSPQPTAKFYGTRQVTVLEQETTSLPLRLTGDGVSPLPQFTLSSTNLCLTAMANQIPTRRFVTYCQICDVDLAQRPTAGLTRRIVRNCRGKFHLCTCVEDRLSGGWILGKRFAVSGHGCTRGVYIQS